MGDPDIEVLKDLARFVQAFPPASPFLARPAADGPAPGCLYLHPTLCLRLTFESTNDIGYGLWRSDRLADAGISCAELDAETFAATLVERLADNLSIRNLQALVAAFQRELDTMEARRQKALARNAG